MNNNPGRKRNSIYNIVTGVGGQIVTIILQFITRTFFIKTLGASYLGLNGLFADILSMLTVTELGINTAITFRLYGPLANNDVKRIRILVKFYKYAYMIIGSIILALGLALIPFFSHIINDYEIFGELGINPVLVFLLYLFQTVISFYFFSYRYVIVIADQKEYRINLVNHISAILCSICQIMGLILVGDYILYIFTSIAFTLLGGLVNANLSKKHYGYAFIKEEGRLSRQEFKDLFKDLGALFIGNINNTVEKATDNIILSAFIGIKTVGLYSNYLLFYTTIKTFLGKACSGVQASMGNLFASESVKKKYQFFEIMNFMVAVLYGTAFVGVSVVSNEMINCWLGEGYTIPFPFSILVGLEILFLGVKINLSQIRSVSGAFRQMWYRPVICSAINLGVSIYLVRIIGIYGVIVGTILADVLTNFIFDPRIIYRQVFFGYYHFIEYYKKNMVYFAVLGALCFINYMVRLHLFTGYGWGSVIIHIVICAVSVPMTFLLLFRTRHECIYLCDFLKSGLKKILMKLRI